VLKAISEHLLSIANLFEALDIFFDFSSILRSISNFITVNQPPLQLLLQTFPLKVLFQLPIHSSSVTAPQPKPDIAPFHFKAGSTRPSDS